MAYTQVTIGGITLQYNPVESKNPPVKTVQRCKTMGGNYFVIWGQFDSDREIQMSWPLMEKSVYDGLATLMSQAGTESFTDEYGVAYTTIFSSLDYGSLLEGGGEFYRDVSVKLFVVSKP